MSDLKYGPLDQAALPLLKAAGRKTTGAPAWELMDWAWRAGIPLPVSAWRLHELREVINLRSDRLPKWLCPPGHEQNEEALAENLSEMSPEAAAAFLWETADGIALERCPGYSDLLPPGTRP